MKRTYKLEDEIKVDIKDMSPDEFISFVSNFDDWSSGTYMLGSDGLYYKSHGYAKKVSP